MSWMLHFLRKTISICSSLKYTVTLILTKTAALKWIVNYSEISAIEEVLCYCDEHGHCRDAWLAVFIFLKHEFRKYYYDLWLKGFVRPKEDLNYWPNPIFYMYHYTLHGFEMQVLQIVGVVYQEWPRLRFAIRNSDFQNFAFFKYSF